jgi:hypothetical protein
VLAFGIVRWPESWSLPLSLIALALVIGQAIRRRSSLDRRGIGVFFAALGPGILIAVGVGWSLRFLGAMPAPWIAYPLPALVSLHTAAAAVSLGILLLLASRSTPHALWAGTWIGWGLLGALTAAFVPGMSYLFIVPTMAAAITGSLPPNIAFAAPAAVAATLVLALATALYEALGFAVPPLVVLPTLLLATTLAPMLVGLDPAFTKRTPRILAGIAVVAAIMALLVPKFSASNAQRVNVVFRQDETATASARVFIDTTWGPATWGAPPDAMLAAIGGSSRKDAALRRKVRARLRSQRGASTIALVFPLGRRVNVRVEGRSAVPRPVDNGSVVGLLGVPAEGILVELDAVGVGPIPITILDRTYGVPAKTKAEDAVNARSKAATTFQDGDVTVISKSLSI